MTLDEILDRLQAGRQRATYGAVAALLRVEAKFLMSGRPPCYRDSWIVGKDTGLPSKYHPDDIDPALWDSAEIIRSGDELRAWLARPVDSAQPRPTPKPRTVFVDVDDTLVRSVGTRRIPMPAVVARVRELHQEGATLYLWSSGGADYARASAAELGIEGCFQGFLPKPDAYLDDQPVADWRYCRHILPGNATDA